jgi:hypothetical protein
MIGGWRCGHDLQLEPTTNDRAVLSSPEPQLRPLSWVGPTTLAHDARVVWLGGWGR